MAVVLGIAGVRLVVDATPEACDATLVVLRHHVEVDRPGPADGTLDLILRFCPDADRDRRWLQRERVSATEWRVHYGAAALDEVPNRFYYRVLLPTLKARLAASSIACFHGAFLRTPSGVRALLLGDGGAGKTTAAGICALSGGAFLSDDIVLWNPRTGTWHGLRRPMHVDPASFGWLSGLPRLDEANPYLPNRQKVAYDWWTLHPTAWLLEENGVDVIVKSEVADGPTTTCEPLALRSGEVLRGALEEPVLDPSICDRAAGGARPYLVRWAPDVWTDPRGPVSVLERLARPSG